VYHAMCLFTSPAFARYSSSLPREGGGTHSTYPERAASDLVGLEMFLFSVVIWFQAGYGTWTSLPAEHSVIETCLVRHGPPGECLVANDFVSSLTRSQQNLARAITLHDIASQMAC